MTTRQPPLPHPPFYTIPNINNLRDPALFPLPIHPSQKIRPNILFRSAEVSKIDRAGWQAVKRIGVAHVFDLRSKPEVEKGWRGITQEKDAGEGEEDEDVRPGWLAEMAAAGVERTWVPVFEDSDYSPERLAERYMKYMDESIEGFARAYMDILQHAGASFRTILVYLADLPPPSESTTAAGIGDGDGGVFLSNDPAAAAPGEESPFRMEKESVGALVHCTAGKDRTGIFFGVLFDFLGVRREAIAREYQLTELGLAHIRDEVVGRLMQSPGLKRYMALKAKGMSVGSEELGKVLEQGGEDGAEQQIPPEILEEGRQAGLRMVGARKESLLRALEMVDEEWGGSEKYLRTVPGLGDEELERLRRVLVVPA